MEEFEELIGEQLSGKVIVALITCHSSVAPGVYGRGFWVVGIIKAHARRIGGRLSISLLFHRSLTAGGKFRVESYLFLSDLRRLNVIELEKHVQYIEIPF
jgi:hypothetical protein